MRYPFRTRLVWRNWVVPEPLRGRPVHRWFVFPHSFSDDIVKSLTQEWNLTKDDRILDPFVGAGTAVLAAKQLNIPAIGFDLSPLAILASNVKTSNYNVEIVRKHWKILQRRIKPREPNGEANEYSELVTRALPGKKLATFHGAKVAIRELDAPAEIRDFFMLLLIAQIPKFSNAVATGGWLSWEPNRRSAAQLSHEFAHTMNIALSDLQTGTANFMGNWRALRADARSLPITSESVTAVITSPPYPNRHDYTRVFGVELMFGFFDWDSTRSLRYQTLHSHPEAKPKRPSAIGYDEPKHITKAIRTIFDQNESDRVTNMLHGYFLDLFLALREIARVSASKGRIALVLGNAQYSGTTIEVDKAAAAIGEQAGLKCTEIRIVRQRGNSAQQMKIYGRNPSRESIVLFQKP